MTAKTTERLDGRRERTSALTARSVAALPEDAVVIVGQLLGDAREDAGLPQSAAARHLGVPQSRIAKIELGRRQLLFLEAVLLADLYGITLNRIDPRLRTPREHRGRRPRIDLPRREAASHASD